MSTPLGADARDQTRVLLLLQIERTLHERSPCFRDRRTYMSAPLVADIEDST